MTTRDLFTTYPQTPLAQPEQGVGELWSGCGAISRFPHDGLSQVLYIASALWSMHIPHND
jgi:hypothetical protein